jgi:hypothetical protein
MTPVHEIVAAIAAEESIYNALEDPALQDASYFRLQALQAQLSAAIREAREVGRTCRVHVRSL